MYTSLRHLVSTPIALFKPYIKSAAHIRVAVLAMFKPTIHGVPDATVMYDSHYVRKRNMAATLMKRISTDRNQQFRVWIVQYNNWHPRQWSDQPPTATAIAPADEGCMTADEASTFLEGFNRTILAKLPAQERPGAGGRWGVLRRVRICYEGDFVPGQPLSTH